MSRALASVLVVLASVPSVRAQTNAAEAARARPNVVVVMTDDQGWGDFGCHGNPILDTPNLDAMAERSARLRRFYVTPVCAPTRASLMTGRWHYRTGVTDTWVGRAQMDPAETTVAELLRDAGYATGIFGKWHLGDCYPMRPQDQGFETALVHRGGGIGQPADPPGGEGRYTDPVLFANGTRDECSGYCTDVYFDRGLAWVREQHAANRPFFLYVATNAPHGPFGDVPKPLYEKYRARDLSNARTPFDGDGHALPDDANEDRRARIFAMIENVDENVGKLFATLDELGATDDTLVLFLCDNGPNGRRYVGGMRGSKSSVYEGGIRSPLFAHWPGRLAAGEVDAGNASVVDLLPTVCDAAGVAVPATLGIDGRSVLPELAREPILRQPRYTFVQVHRGDVPKRYRHATVIGPRWKLVHHTGFGGKGFTGEPRFELFDLVDDPLELRDVAAAQPAVVAELRSAYDAWFDDVTAAHDPDWLPPAIRVGTPHENPTALTWQDWRGYDDAAGWGKKRRGEWHVDVTPGRYDVEVRWAAADVAETLTLSLVQADRPRVLATRSLAAGATAVLLPNLLLPGGRWRLRAELRAPDGARRGAYQVVVRRVGASD